MSDAPDEIYEAVERILKPYIAMIPPQCDSHGRVDVIPTTDGDEVCEICHGDGFSGELGHVHADTMAIEVVGAIWGKVTTLPMDHFLQGRVADWLADHPKGEAFNLVRDLWHASRYMTSPHPKEA